jgi:hypothetical protein
MDLGLIIDEYKEIITFYKSTAFNEFINHFQNMRKKAVEDKDDGLSNFFKIILNASYGKDGQNTAKYPTNKLCNEYQALMLQGHSDFISSRKIKDNFYSVNLRKKFYYVNTPIQCAVWTLDNGKFWILNFLYNFMYKAFDRTKFHLIEGDTDSLYFAVAGDPNDDYKQGFKHIIKDQKFYDENVYKWYPDPSKGPSDKKKLLKIDTEKEGDEMIALGPKCYYIHTLKKDVMKVKGGSLARNPHIGKDSYMKPIEASNAEILLRTEKEKDKIEELNNKVKQGIITLANCSFQKKKLHSDTLILCKVEVHKNAITPKHNKVMTILSNQSCIPFVPGITLDNCVIRNEK